MVHGAKGTLRAVPVRWSNPGALDGAAATALLRSAERGTTEMLAALDGTPLLVVDLGDHPDLRTRPPQRLAGVVVGVLHRPAGEPAPAGVDVALCTGPSGQEPPGWVATQDPDAALDRLATATARSPRAAAILCEVLRLGEALPLADAGGADTGLLVESLAYSTLQSGPELGTWLATREATRPGTPPAVETEPAVVIERRGDQLWLTLNRPHVRNAVDARLRDELVTALALAATDPTVTAVHLAGAGPDFSSGGDLREFGTRPDGATAHLVRTTRSPASLLARLSGRTVAHLHGQCVGAGIELPAFAGRVVATADTVVWLPELGFGLMPGAGGTVSVARRIGRQRTAWLALSGARMRAPAALAWGLVDEVVPSERADLAPG